MILKRLTVRGYRGFRDSQTLDLAIPDGTPGSGLTLLVGPNNAGKSSVVEVMSLLRDPTYGHEIGDAQRNAISGRNVSCEYELDSGKVTWNAGPNGELRWAIQKSQVDHGQLLHIPSRRPLPESFQPRAITRQEYARQVSGTSPRNTQHSSFLNRLYTMDGDFDHFIRVVRDVFPGAPEWHVVKNPGSSNSALKISGAAGAHFSEGLGDGFAHGLQVLDSVFDAPGNCVVVIDEPELSLHPAAARRTAMILAEAARRCQVVVATHSPFFAPIELLENGMRLARVSMRAGSAHIHTLSHDTGKRLARLTLDVCNPHAMGLEAREVFFLPDHVILVEGQDDALGYPRAIQAVKDAALGTFFGWGTGGADKFPVICQTLRELGFTKVFGILDGDRADQVPQLVESFPEFSFANIRTTDIRDKPKRGVTGMMTEGLNLKPEFADDIRALVRRINGYMAR